MRYAVLDSNMEYKKDLDGNVRVFDSVRSAVLFFTIGNHGYTESPNDETVLIYRDKKLKIIPYIE